jgi:hypothetical protein
MRVRAIANILYLSSVSCFLLLLLVLPGCGGGKGQMATNQPTTALPPAVSLSISPASVLPGQSATLTWSATSASSCTADGAWTGAQQMNGSITVTLPSSSAQTYVLECTGTGITARGSVTLALSPADGACAASHAVAAATAKRLGRRRALSAPHS